MRPLFDSFAIDFDRNLRKVVTPVFQITIATMRGRSAGGHDHKHVKVLLKDVDPKATVETAYCLVSPDERGESRNRRLIPAGWNKVAAMDDRRGPVSCIRIPAPGTPYLSIPISRPNGILAVSRVEKCRPHIDRNLARQRKGEPFIRIT